jgi:hypothetical protein
MAYNKLFKSVLNNILILTKLISTYFNKLFYKTLAFFYFWIIFVVEILIISLVVKLFLLHYYNYTKPKVLPVLRP